MPALNHGLWVALSIYGAEGRNVPLNVPPTKRTQVSPPPKRTELPYYIHACALGLPAYLTGINLWTWVFTLGLFLRGRADFLAFYTAGYIVRTGRGHDLYNYQFQLQMENILMRTPHPTLPFYHLAYESFLFVPLSAVSYKSAYFLFLAFNLTLVVICFWLLRPWMGNLARVYRLFPIAVFTSFLPLGVALIQGQDSVMILALLTISFVLLENRQNFWAGAALGLAAFKFQIVAPIALLFLLWRRWRFVIGLAMSVSIVMVVTIRLVGVHEIKGYSNWVLSISAHASAADYARNSIPPNRMPNLRGLLFALTNDKLQNFGTQAAIFVSSGILLLWVGVRNRGKGATALLVAIPTAALVSYHMLVHDLCILLIPVTWTLNRFLFSKSDSSAAEKWLVNSAALVVCAQMGQSFFPDHFYLVSIAILAFLFIFIFQVPGTDLQPEPACP
jgi:hypothetical protein